MLIHCSGASCRSAPFFVSCSGVEEGVEYVGVGRDVRGVGGSGKWVRVWRRSVWVGGASLRESVEFGLCSSHPTPFPLLP